MRLARRRLGIGVVGFGWMGRAHSRSMLRIPTLFSDRRHTPELVICSDTVAARVDEALRDFGFREGTENWQRVVEHPDVDVVMVTAPNMLHLPVIEAATKAGKHVFCEKPLGISVAEAAEMTRAAEASGLIHQIAFTYRHLHGVTELRRLVQERSVSRTSFVLIMNTGRGFSRPRRSVGGGCEALLVAACSTIRARIFLISRALSSDRSRQSARTCSFFPGGASRLTTLRQYVSASPRVSGASGTLVGSRHREPITTCRWWAVRERSRPYSREEALMRCDVLGPPCPAGRKSPYLT